MQWLKAPSLGCYARKKKYFQNPQGTGPEKHRSGNGKWRTILSNSAPVKGTGIKGVWRELLSFDNGRSGLCSQDQQTSLWSPPPRRRGGAQQWRHPRPTLCPLDSKEKNSFCRLTQAPCPLMRGAYVLFQRGWRGMGEAGSYKVGSLSFRLSSICP